MSPRDNKPLRINANLVLTNHELSSAWKSLYFQRQPRLKKLLCLTKRQWVFLAELLTSELQELSQAQERNQVH